MGLTFVLWLSALRLSASTARIANLIFLSPFLSLLFIHLFVGEQIVPSTLVGLALIMGGLLVQRLKARTADGS
jgi:drug/metabolite transporter (DMT)-like permease